MTGMTIISPKHTQLPVVVWIEADVAGNTQHCIPRLRFQNSTSDIISTQDLIPISISKEPEILIKDFDMNNLNISNDEFKLLKQWITCHYDNLMDYWSLKIDTVEFFSNLRKE